MDTLKKFAVAVPLIFLALIPPVKIDIPMTVNSSLWMWLILLAGFLGISFVYHKIGLTLKVLIVYLFVSCFSSRAPYLSFTAYIVFMLAAYYYLLCLKLKNFDFVLNIAQALLFLNVILVVNQQFHGDTLLNFSRPDPVCFGTIGNPMWLGSFLSCLAPFLLISSPLNLIPLLLIAVIAKSAGMALSVFVGMAVYGVLKYRKSRAFWVSLALVAIFVLFFAFSRNVFYKFAHAGRGPVWGRCVQLVNKQPVTGWGIGTFKVIFPVFSKDVAGGTPGPWEYEGTKGDWLAWRQAHNCWLQILFETGYLGFGIFSAFIGLIFLRLLAIRNAYALTGFFIIASNMLVHYPTRMIQSVPFIIVFLAYCAKLTSKEGV